MPVFSPPRPGPPRLGRVPLGPVLPGDTTQLAEAWVGTPVFGNSSASVTLDFTLAPVGEWLFACIGLGDSQTAVEMPRAPNGWGEVIQGCEGLGPGASSRNMVYLRRKQPGDTTFLFSWNSACNFAAYPISWLGLDPVTPVEVPTYNPHASGTNYATAALAPTRDNRRIVGMFFARTTTQAGSQFAFTPPPGMTERGDVASTSSAWCILEVADTIGTAQPTSQTFTAVGPTSSHGGTIAFALIPVGGGPLVVGAPSILLRPGAGPSNVGRFWRTPRSTDIIAVGPVNTPLGLNVPVAGAAGVVKQVGAGRQVTATGTAGLVRQAGKQLPAAGSGTAGLLRGVGKQSRVAAAGSVSLVKAVAHTVTVAGGGTAGLVKQVGKTLTVAVAGTVGLAAQKVRLVVVTVASSVTVALGKQVGKRPTVTAGGTVGLVKQAGRRLTASAVGGAGLAKSIGRRVATTVAVQVALQAVKQAGSAARDLRVLIAAPVAKWVEHGPARKWTVGQPVVKWLVRGPARKWKAGQPVRKWPPGPPTP